MKTLKFSDTLVPLVLSGAKDSTWRLFDDKDLRKGDELSLVNKDTGEQFAKAHIVFVQEKQLNKLDDTDQDGHELYESEEKMLEDFRKYYGDRVTLESMVKVIKFKLAE
ncbi:MAG: ASCH domain-containing protein [Patescibacteria group bacterium]